MGMVSAGQSHDVPEGAVLYLSHFPGPPLSQFVDRLWILTGAQIPRKERILPGGTIELVINLRENEIRIHDPLQPQRCKRFSGAILSGVYSRAFVCDANQHEAIAGVHFRPGGAAPFLNEAASELADTHADLAELWGRPAGSYASACASRRRLRNGFR